MIHRQKICFQQDGTHPHPNLRNYLDKIFQLDEYVVTDLFNAMNEVYIQNLKARSQ